MPRTSSPGLHPSGSSRPDAVPAVLDPVLVPLGFAPGQVQSGADAGQVIWCRGVVDSSDGGCVDLVVEVTAAPDWQITDVRYWGFPSDRWHLDFIRGASLADQLADLTRTLPTVFG